MTTKLQFQTFNIFIVENQMPVHLSIPTEGVYVCVCVSGEAPDDGEQAHDAVQDSNAIAHVETMARRISRRKHTTNRFSF